MNLQDQILDELSEQMHSAIDFEILTDVLVKSCGWHRVDLERFANNTQAVDITAWCHDKIKGNWKRNGCHFIFEQSSDALLFTLKWK
jgi:predicted metal-dependent HD superfamily phosphohydrolase